MGKKVYEKGRMSSTVKIAKLSLTTIRCNLRAVLKQATQAEIDGGMVAYADYRRVMQEVADRYSVPVSNVTGVFCALSPNSDWRSNLRSMITLVKGYVDGLNMEDVTVTTYNRNKRNAWCLVQGEPFDKVYKGLKVNNFYRSIVNPQDPEPAAVDGHLANVARNQQNGMGYSGLSGGEYKRVKECLIKVARQRDMLPSQLQAILWFTWKRIHDIKAASTVEMFDRETNSLRPYVDTSWIRPFPRKEKPIEGDGHRQMILFCE